MNKQPLLSVLLPVYNAELYIKEALASILNQTYTNFECIVIDDASTDKSVDIIESFKDDRVKLIRKEQNTGYTKNLNYGLSIAKGKYIARMDADDISRSTRFEKQVAQFELNSKLVVCGTIFKIIDSETVINNPEIHEDIKFALLKDSAIGHPTAMIRSSIIQENKIKYNHDTEPAEDYDLWVTLLKYGEFYNIQEVLFDYRIHDGQVSYIKREKQRKSASLSRCKMLKHLGVDLTKSEEEAYVNLFSYTEKMNVANVTDFISIKNKLMTQSNDFIPLGKIQDYFKMLEKNAVRQCFIGAKQYNLKLFRDYQNLKSKLDYKLSFKEELKLLLYSLIKRNVS